MVEEKEKFRLRLLQFAEGSRNQIESLITNRIHESPNELYTYLITIFFFFLQTGTRSINFCHSNPHRTKNRPEASQANPYFSWA